MDLAAAQQRRISSSSIIGGGISVSGVIGGGVRGSGIFLLPLYLVINLHIIVRIDLDSVSAATETSVAASAATYDDGGRLPIPKPTLIPIPSGRSSGSGTSRGDSGGGTVGDSYLSQFSEVSSEKIFTLTSLDIYAQGKLRVKPMKKYCL